MRWFVFLLSTIIIVSMDVEFYVNVQEFGGFEAWRTRNMFWQHCIYVAGVFHLLYLLGIVLVWLDYKKII